MGSRIGPDNGGTDTNYSKKWQLIMKTSDREEYEKQTKELI